jgi:hypothetical protein
VLLVSDPLISASPRRGPVAHQNANPRLLPVCPSVSTFRTVGTRPLPVQTLRPLYLGRTLNSLHWMSYEDPTLYSGIGKALSDSIHQRKAEGLGLLNGLERQIRARKVGDPEATYKIAEAYAVLGDKISAGRALRTSVESGFFSYPYLSTDPLLNDLRSEPEFDEILQKARQRHEAFKCAFFK